MVEGGRDVAVEADEKAAEDTIPPSSARRTYKSPSLLTQRQETLRRAMAEDGEGNPNH